MGSVKSVSSVRERNVLRERMRCPPLEIKLSTILTSRPVGVTSHFTPLPTGEGPGEGPTVVVCWLVGGEAASYLTLYPASP